MNYGYSSTFPRVPNSTPQLPASIRPPIHNPYDKFTQPQFDEWVGSITGALKRALGKEEDEILSSQPMEPREGGACPISDTDEDNVEDSFAEWKAMRAKEKGKMRATEDEQDSECGGVQEIYEDSGIQDHAAGNTPDDAIELLSDDDDAEGEKHGAHRGCDDEDLRGGSIENLSSVESDEEVEHSYFGSLQPARSPNHYPSANATRQQAIEISDGETERHDQADDPFEAENRLFGWGEDEERECQQPPDVRDPWELPKTYAEDLYTGGPIPGTDRSKLSPSNLTPSTEEANHLDNVVSRHRPPSILVPQPTDHSLAKTSPIPPTRDRVSNSDDEVSPYNEGTPELDAPTTAPLQADSDFVSFTALDQPSDAESERGGPEVLYISDNDGGEVSEDDKEVEEGEFDDDGLIPLGTSDLEIPSERGLEEDGGEEIDELEDDEGAVAEVPSNHPYGYYGLDASSVTGSGGIDDDSTTVGPTVDTRAHNEVPDMKMPQESASLLDPHDLSPLPAAANFIDIDHYPRPVASVAVDKSIKASLAEVSLTILDGTPTISDEVVVGIEDPGTVDEDPVGDDTILADGAVLTVNEVEEVLRDAFAETDRLVPTPSTRGTTSISDSTPVVGEQNTRTQPKSGPSDTTPEFSARPPPRGPTIKDENLAGLPPSSVKDETSNSQKAEKESLPFVMPLIANPNVRDPMSAPWSPIQSGPSTPIANLESLPIATKFKRDGQLLGVAHGSGLFTPLEGSGSSSPSPSDTATPEDRPITEVELVVPAVDDNGRHQEVKTNSVKASPASASPEIQDVESTPILPKDCGWGEASRLPIPPVEAVDHVEETPAAVLAARVSFPSVKPGDNVDAFNARSKAGPDESARDDDNLSRGFDNLKPLVQPSGDAAKCLSEVTEAGDPFKLMGNNSTVAPGAVANDDGAPPISPSSPDEEPPRLKLSETPALVAEDSSRTREDSDVSAKTRSLRKRKRSASPIRPKPTGSERLAKKDIFTTSLRDGEGEEANHELTKKEPRNKEEHDSDNESFASSLVAPRNADLFSQDDSRASSVVSEQPVPLQSRTPVPEDAPVFHGHGKFKAALKALKLHGQKSESRAQEPGLEKARLMEGLQEKDRPLGTKKAPGSENDPNGSTETKKPLSLVLPVVSTQVSLPSTSTSQSPVTPASALPSSPTVITVPVEVTAPPQQEQGVQEPTKPNREPIKKPAVKAVKRTTSRKSSFFEPKSTRSQCRYRKISLPREENGPRVTFCVPQCSLNRKDLMEEEDITDDGLATVRDFERLWDHVEEQNLDPYLIGVIRQLVGLDLLRENEVYYLPTDEEVKQIEREQEQRKERRRSRRSIGGATNVDSTSVGFTSQPSLSQVGKGKLDPPPSFAESVSTTSTRSKIDRGGSARSVSGDEMSDGERGGKKRRRTGKEQDGGSLRNTPSVREDSAAPSIAGSPAPSQSTTERTPTRRSRRTLKKAISTDSQAYKPTFSSGESSEDESEKTRKSARGGPKGLKRRRTEGAGDSSILSVTGGVGDHDGPLSPRSTRSKRAKIDEK